MGNLFGRRRRDDRARGGGTSDRGAQIRTVHVPSNGARAGGRNRLVECEPAAMKMRVMVFILTGILFAVPALAQQPQQPQPAAGSGMTVQEIESGFVIAPELRFTEVNDKAATLAGVYGGWLTDRTLLVGAGAYWLTNRASDFKMQYFGGLVRVNAWGHRRVALSTGALIGFGDATLSVRSATSRSPIAAGR